MPPNQTDQIRPMPSIVPSDSDIPTLSDDECLFRLAKALEEHDSQDSQDLDEVAKLIGRLAVTIE
jgi:hypothetical protein